MIQTILPSEDNTPHLKLMRDVRVQPASSAATILVVDDEPRNVGR